jgi:hypothetical protein
MPRWAAELPAVEVSYSVGQDVWATPPQPDTEIALVEIFSVEGVYGGHASLIDRRGQRVDGVPLALVHPSNSLRKVEQGELVLCYARKLPTALARVAEVSAGSEIEVNYDWSGKTKTAAIEHAEKPVTGIRPMAFVGFIKGGSRSRGLLVALSDDKAWVQTGSGKIEVRPRDELTELPLPELDRKVGDGVAAFSWATGYRPGVIRTVLEPGLRYRVALDDGSGETAYFFSSLIPSL